MADRSRTPSPSQVGAPSSLDTDHRETQRKLSTLMANLPGMAYRTLLDGDYSTEFVSRGCKALTGYDDADYMAGRVNALRDIVHPRERDRVIRRILRAVAEKRPFELVYHGICADGVQKAFWEKGEGVCDAAGHPVAIEGFVTDFTQYKQAEARLVRENQRLARASIDERYRLGGLVGKSPAMRRVYEAILRAARTDAHLVIGGESGTGKELAARIVHRRSARADAPFVPVNCGAVPAGLAESLFFGFRKGSFTGAVRDSRGYFGMAEKGVLFLDELAEMDCKTQSMLLRVIDGGGYLPLGGRQPRYPDVRVIAASNRDLWSEVQNGRLRHDLYYRLNVLSIDMPPLRERREDINLLVDHFLAELVPDAERSTRMIAFLGETQGYPWPGNVRELENAVRRFVHMGRSGLSGQASAPPPPSASSTGPAATLAERIEICERDLIRQALEENRWNRRRTAAALGITARTLHRKLNHHSLR